MGKQADDEAQILRLDSEWNEAHRRHDRAPLAQILADGFTGLTRTWQTLAPPRQERYMIEQVFGEMYPSEAQLRNMIEIAALRMRAMAFPTSYPRHDPSGTSLSRPDVSF